MGRAPCCEKDGLKKGPWTPEEDQKLKDYIQRHGYGNWRTLPQNAGICVLSLFLYVTFTIPFSFFTTWVCIEGLACRNWLLFRAAKVWKKLSSSLD